MATTLKDIAKRLNISVSTVSYALTESGRTVPAAVKERVLEAAREMNYRPNRLARSMITGKTNVIGVVPSEMHDDLFLSPYLQIAFNGITNEAGHQHKDLLVYTRFRETDGHEVMDAILDGRVDGVIFVCPHIGQTTLGRVAASGLPCVAIGAPQRDGVVTINADNRGGMKQVIRHLVELGHTRIAHMAGRLNMDDALLRLRAYQEAMHFYGLTTRDDWICKGGFTREGGYEAMIELLDSKDLPTAIACSNDEMAIGAIRAAQDRGLDIPGDISITGFDLTPSGTAVTPPLTTVRQPIAELGAAAVSAVVRLIEGEQEATSQTLPTEFILQSSTTSPKEDH